MLLNYIGKHSPGTEARFQETCRDIGIGQEVRFIRPDGEPIASLLSICKENLVDLLVLGTLRRETMFRYYLGSVARGVCRRAKCSLLLLTEPRIGGSQFNKIVTDCVHHRKTIPTLNTAFYLARQTGCHEIRVVKEIDQAGLAMAMSDDSTTGEQSSVKKQLFIEAENTIQEALIHCEVGEIKIVKTVLFGRPGFTIRKYAEDCRADLLVIKFSGQQIWTDGSDFHP